MVIDKKYLDPFILATERAAYGASLFKGKGIKLPPINLRWMK